MSTEIIEEPGHAPTFFNNLIDFKEEIELISLKKVKLNTPDCSKSDPQVSIISESSPSIYELTGNPLSLTLSEDPTLVLIACPDGIRRPNRWKETEEKYPLDIATARRLLNDQRNRRKTRPVLLVCDGADPKHTVMIGCKRKKNIFLRTTASVLGHLPLGHPKLQINFMKSEHSKNCLEEYQTHEVNIVAVYELYGFDLSQDSDYFSNGCVSIEGSWNSWYFEPCEFGLSYNLTLQTVLGHKDSFMCAFWTKFELLGRLIEILKCDGKNLVDSVICDKPKANDEVINTVCDLLESQATIFFKKKCLTNFQTAFENIDTVINCDITDKVWSALIYCNTVADLKECLQYFLTALVNSEVSNFYIAEDNKTTLATIINDIINGKASMPNLSFSQSFQIFIEIGIETIRKKFFGILILFEICSKNELVTYWSPTLKIAKPTNTPSSVQRIVLNPALALLPDLSDLMLRITKLFQLYIPLDFLCIVEQSDKLGEQFEFISQNLFTTYMKSNSPIDDFVNYEPNQVFEHKLLLNEAKPSLVKGIQPASWKLTARSSNETNDISTVFYFTDRPQFPPTIFNDYDKCLADVKAKNEALYYATQCNVYIYNIK